MISEMIIKEKTLFFAQQFNISHENISFSNGWIQKFKRCNNIHKYHLHGKANSASLETLSEERNKLWEILKNYPLENIFNINEMGLFFHMTLNQTLASAPTPNTKWISK